MKKISAAIVYILLFVTMWSVAYANESDIRITLQSSRISLDPGGIQDSQSLFVSRQVNCQFVRSQGSVYVMDAAESIKYITPLKIRLKIRGDKMFHDGSPVQAEDVLASFNYIKRSRNILGSLFNWIDKIEIINDKTIIFSLKREVPQLLKVLSSTNFNIFKKQFLERANNDKSLWKNPLGCGGYKVTSFTDNYIKLSPVSKGLPLTFYLVKENQIDASDLPKYDIVSISVIGKSKEADDFSTFDMFDPVQFYIGLNARSKVADMSDSVPVRINSHSAKVFCQMVLDTRYGWRD